MPEKNIDDEWTYGKPYKTIDAETGEEVTMRIAYAPRNLIKAAHKIMKERAEAKKDIASKL